MSPWWNSTSSGRFARFPEYVSLSSTTTSSPAASSRLTKCEPMKPAPPVTRTRIVVLRARVDRACELGRIARLLRDDDVPVASLDDVLHVRDLVAVLDREMRRLGPH